MRQLGEGVAVLLLLLAIAVMIGLGGCAAAPPRAPEIVRVPVPTPCLQPGQVPAPPALTPDPALAGLDDYDLVRVIAAERASLAAWLLLAVPALKACEDAP